MQGLAGVMNWFVAILQFLLVRLVGQPCSATVRKRPLTPGDARGMNLSHESPHSGWLTLLAVQSLRARPPTGQRPMTGHRPRSLPAICGRHSRTGPSRRQVTAFPGRPSSRLPDGLRQVRCWRTRRRRTRRSQVTSVIFSARGACVLLPRSCRRRMPCGREQTVELWHIPVTAAIACILTFVAVKFLDRLRRRDAETEAAGIIEKAQRESANMKKEAELEIEGAGHPAKGRGRARAEQDPARAARARAAARQAAGRASSSRPTSCASRRRWSRATSGSWPSGSKTPTAATKSWASCSTCSGRRCTSSAA